MYKIPANTLFIGKNLVFVPECPSTNTLAAEISHQSPVKDGTVVITDSQTAGRGQRGNTWETTPGLNLTFSIVLKPGFLALTKQFFLNIVASLALKDYLMREVPGAVYIKWPNDILVHDKKISGILIENQVQGSSLVTAIIGIGFNLNQKNFSNLARATSLAMVTGKDYDRHREVELILEYVESRYLQLRRGNTDGLMSEYLASLYRRNEKHWYRSEGRLFEGIIRDLDEIGNLRVEENGMVRSYGVKEIEFVDQ